MKRILSIILAAAMTAGLFVLPASAAAPPASVWDADTRSFYLKDGPAVTRILSESNENGTWAGAFVGHTDDFAAIGTLYYTARESDKRLYASALGLDPDNVEANLEVGVQLAYSFDGVNWVNDRDAGDGYAVETYFDDDEDGFNEYLELPGDNTDLESIDREITVFNGAAGFMTPRYCYPIDDMTVRQALTLRNDAILQGVGEFTGSDYVDDDENGGHGFAVDLGVRTLYVKARYRVYNRLSVREGDEWSEYEDRINWSDWGPVKAYNNSLSAVDLQDCVPDMRALLTDAEPTLVALDRQRSEKELDDVTVKTTAYRFAVRYPADTKKALVRFYALDDNDLQEELTGERYDPKIVIEIRIADGEWYYFDSPNARYPYFTFDDDVYWVRDLLEDLGYEPGDPVYLRVRLYGNSSFSETRPDGALHEKVSDSDEVFMRSGISNVVEMSLSGKFNVRYEIDGGRFPVDTTQVKQFDEDSSFAVDLTSAEYTPEFEHHVFGGWFTDPDLTPESKVTGFDTSVKASRIFYAKWTELPYRRISYDLGIVTDYVHNPNHDKVYSDDGDMPIEDVSYAGTDFLGWYDAKTGGKKITSINYADLSSDVTLYARWNVPTKTISYSGAGKDYVNAPANPSEYRVDPSGATRTQIKAPTRTGYIFDGWYTDPALDKGELPYDAATGTYSLDASDNVTLWAKWILGRWKINYVLGLPDAYNSLNPDVYTYGTAVKLEAPSRTGYIFDGWYTDEAKTAKTDAISATQTGEVTLWAKWTEIKYDVNCMLGEDKNELGVTTNPNPAKRGIDEEVVLRDPVASNKSYVFLGWYDNVNYDGDKITVIKAGTDKNVTLWAKWYRHIWGDADQDGRVSAADARLVLRAAVGLEKLGDAVKAWVDVSDHGAKHEISAADARTVLRMAVGLDSVESVGLPKEPVAL